MYGIVPMSIRQGHGKVCFTGQGGSSYKIQRPLKEEEFGTQFSKSLVFHVV